MQSIKLVVLYSAVVVCAVFDLSLIIGLFI